ncbi:MAG: biotin transporter BioY [Bacilli bacterium]|jgi:biotin transport system substrate-specific component
MTKNQKIIRSIAKMAMLLALLIVCSYINISVGLLKFTLQLLVVFLIGLYANLYEGMIIIFSYIFLGLVGVPVFANFGGGIAYLVSPTFGFVYGFIPGILIMNLIRFLFRNVAKFKVFQYILSCVSCLLIVYIVGFVHGYFILNYYLGKSYDFVSLLGLFILPYIPYDCIKLGVAVVSKLAIDKVYAVKASRV